MLDLLLGCHERRAGWSLRRYLLGLLPLWSAFVLLRNMARRSEGLGWIALAASSAEALWGGLVGWNAIN